MRPTFLVCPPDHFDVHYRINPWMQPEQWSQHSVELLSGARLGWRRLIDTLRSLGAAVISLPARQGLPDLVFTANAAVVLNGTVLLARFRHPERRGEEPHVAQFFNELRRGGVVDEVHELPAGIELEGAGDCVWDATRQLFWVGHGQRSDAAGAAAVQQTFDVETVPLELVNPRYYHLDTCLCPLEGGHILYVPEAFSAAGMQQIHSRVPESLRVAVRAEDAEQLAANAVCLGRNVILSQCSASLRAALEARDYGVHQVNIPQFALSGGSVCCLTLRLDRCSEPAAAQRLRRSV